MESRGVQQEDFLFGQDGMSAAVRAFDWSATPLGPISAWPVALRTVVGLMLGSRFPKCIVWGPELITIYNDAFRPILGQKPEALGRPFSDVWAEAWELISPIVERAYQGEATFIEDFPLTVERNGYPEPAHFTFCYSPIRDEAGQIVGMMDTVIETTGKVQTERNIRLLNAELEHRIKNTLAMVAGIAHQTFRAADTLESAQTILTQRLTALGNAHTILTQSSWSGAPTRAVIEGALAPHRSGGRRISITGPRLELSARQALSLSLAINELATNALKYGALSGDTGTVRIVWETGAPDSSDAFRLTWTEDGGPAVEVPTRRGFGTRLIERALAADFGGSVTIDFAPTGLRCELVTTMDKLRIEPEE